MPGQVCLGNHEEPHRAAERPVKSYCQETLVFKVKGGNQAMTYLFIPALFSLAVIASVWIRDAVEGNSA
jgi:hypothetical protein